MEGEMEPLAKQITVEKRRFVENQESRLVFKVNPGHIELHEGETVTIHFMGLGGGMVLLPRTEIFGRHVFKLPPGKDSKVRMKVRKTAPLGSFSYAVICHEEGEDYYGEGTSPPKMKITDPPQGPP